MYYYCVSVARTVPEKTEEVFAAALVLAEAARREPGNIYYEVLRPDNAPDTVVLTEKWLTREDFAAHTKGEACRAFGPVIDGASDGPSQIFECTGAR